MKTMTMVPMLAAALLMTACKDDGDPTGGGKTASVRFFNATTGLAGSGGFTANGEFAAGSSLGYGQSTPGCVNVKAGTIAFGFGNANGTGLSSALATLNGQTITAGGNYTLVATGAASSPQLYLFDNSWPGTLSGNQAAVRFVNLHPGPETLPYVFNVFAGGLPPEGTIVQLNMFVGAPTPFVPVASGTKAYTVIIGHQLETMSDVSLTLQPGSRNTFAIVSNQSGGYQLINIPGC